MKNLFFPLFAALFLAACEPSKGDPLPPDSFTEDALRAAYVQGWRAGKSACIPYCGRQDCLNFIILSDSLMRADTDRFSEQEINSPNSGGMKIKNKTNGAE